MVGLGRSQISIAPTSKALGSALSAGGIAKHPALQMFFTLHGY